MARRKEKVKRFRMKPTVEDLAIELLRKNKKPMDYKDILKQITETHPLGVNSPEKTVYSVLYRSKKVRLLGNGIFDLKKD